MGLKDEMAAFAGQMPVSASNTRAQRRSSIPAPTALLNSMAGYTELQQKYEQLLVEQGRPVVLDIEDLVYSPYQTWGINKQRVEELVENLKQNPQSSPIVVRINGEGRKEVVAGHHRIEAFKILMRRQINGVIVEMTDDEASRALVYDNVMGPEWSDFRKFKGFLSRKQFAGLSNIELAEEAGMSKAQITKIMSFGDLPQDALDVMEKYEDIIGCNLAYELSRIEGEGRAFIKEALMLISEGRLAQNMASKWISEKITGQADKGHQPKEERVIQVGGKDFAKIKMAPGRLSISFKNKEMAEKFGPLIEELIAKHGV